jgi:hypothetical protein
VEGYVDMLFAARTSPKDWFKIVAVVYKDDVLEGALHFKCVDVDSNGEHVYIECTEILSKSKHRKYDTRNPNVPPPVPKKRTPRRKFNPYRYEIDSTGVSTDNSDSDSSSEVDINCPRRTRYSSRSTSPSK